MAVSERNDAWNVMQFVYVLLYASVFDWIFRCGCCTLKMYVSVESIVEGAG